MNPAARARKPPGRPIFAAFSFRSLIHCHLPPDSLKYSVYAIRDPLPHFHEPGAATCWSSAGGCRRAENAGAARGAARVTVVSPAFSAAFDRLKSVTFVRRRYAAGHMRRRKWSLVFAASNVATVNRQVQKDAAAAGIPCCRCDKPERGDFNNGATASVGPVLLSVSTGGARGGVVGEDPR